MKQAVAALKNRIRASRREIPSDLVLKKGRVVNVFSGSIEESDVAIYKGFILGLGDDISWKRRDSALGPVNIQGPVSRISQYWQLFSL